MSNEITKYQDPNGNEITLTPAIVKAYVSTDAGVSDKEVMMFMKLCEHQKLNPFLREIYLVKYGTSPATFVTGKETFLKRAKRDPNYAGHKVWSDGEGDQMTATAEVYVKGYQCPITVTVDYLEYVALKDEWANGKKTGKKFPNNMWATKPKTMLKKVALVQALREAFPDTFGGMYSQEEISTVDMERLETAPINVTPVSESDTATAEAATQPAEQEEDTTEPEPEAEKPKPKAKQEKKPEPEPEPEPKPKKQSEKSAQPSLGLDLEPLPEVVRTKMADAFKPMSITITNLEANLNKAFKDWTIVEKNKLAVYYRLAAMNIGIDLIEAKVECHMEDWGDEEIKTLQSIISQLTKREIHVDEAFPSAE